VTLEQDLERRDLTINAIARDEDGLTIDPFNGTEDLDAGILRHVSPAFAEDPVRILRVARFVARFGFDIAPETAELMRQMVQAGEADALVPERVWQEVARGLMEAAPSRMIEVLRECGALARIMPELGALFEDSAHAQATLRAVDATAGSGAPLEVRFAALSRGLDPYAVEALADRLKLPAAVRDLALLAARHANAIVDAEALPPESVLDLFNVTDVWRRPERFEQLLQAAVAGEPETDASLERLRQAYSAALKVDAGAVAKSTPKGGAIRERVNAARLTAIASS